jgi:hypothetical protein
MMERQQRAEFSCNLTSLSPVDRKHHIERTKRIFSTMSLSIKWLCEALEITMDKQADNVLGSFAARRHLQG